MQTTTERPADSAGELYYPTDVSPEEAFKAIGRLRKEARDEIDRLIRFLDDTDNHMEREENGDELDASYPESGSRACSAIEDDEPSGDENEPALGSVNTHHSQTKWAEGNRDDREGDGCADDREGDELEHGGDEHDGSEPDQDGEPSLGWTVDGVIGNDQDLEAGPGARRPQNRTCVPSSIKGMRALRSRMRGGYLDTLRFDQAISTLKNYDSDTLLGGELSFPGGQKAFDEMMRS